ncbi:MAG: hypothetical protein ACE5HE_10645 [Phycisphaerae bacterium]
MTLPEPIRELLAYVVVLLATGVLVCLVLAPFVLSKDRDDER